MKNKNQKNLLRDLSFDYIETFIDSDKIKFFTELFENGPIDERGCISFFWHPSTTSKNFPQFAHILLGRDDPSPRSIWYDYFREIVVSFLGENKLKYKKILRSCINLTYHIPNCEFTDPHVDDVKDHYVIILYLNETDGNTILFDKQYEYGDSETFSYDSINTENFPIKKEIKPEYGKILCFNGKYYHAIRTPPPGKIRTICIFNIEF